MKLGTKIYGAQNIKAKFGSLLVKIREFVTLLTGIVFQK
jgi:hypothetical protein